MLIIIRGEKVLRANKFDFTGHPYSKRMIQSSVMDYNLDDKNSSQTETEIHKNIENKPAFRQTENKKPQKSRIPAGEPLFDPVSQTGTENNPDTPEDNPDTIFEPPFSQTETKNHLDESNGHAAQVKNATIQNESGINEDLSSGSTVQQQKNPAVSQTEIKNNKKKPTRRASNQLPETDYTKLLESFKSQSNKKSKQYKKDNPADELDNPNETDNLKERTLFVPDNETPDNQIETVLPLETTSTQNEFVESLDFGLDSFDSSVTGNDNPPDDF